MKAEIRLIWQTAINLGFQFNETDAHEMWYEIRKFQIKQKEREVEQFYETNNTKIFRNRRTDISSEENKYLASKNSRTI